MLRNATIGQGPAGSRLSSGRDAVGQFDTFLPLLPQSVLANRVLTTRVLADHVL